MFILLKRYVDFKVKNLKSGDEVHYAFSNERVFKPVAVKQVANEALFSIPVPERFNGTLTVYINHKSMAAYRID